MTSLTDLPAPCADAQALSQRLLQRIHHKIAQHGPMEFSRFMAMALYEPGLGYYSAGSRKFGVEGDFITAPEASPLFAACLANQIAELVKPLPTWQLVEAGAGSGKLAVDLLLALERLQSLPAAYVILEVSADLKQRQRQLLQKKCGHLSTHIRWQDQLPNPGFDGVVLANELFDAMPVHLLKLTERQNLAYFVDQEQGAGEQALNFITGVINEPLLESYLQLIRNVLEPSILENGYTTEINLMQHGWIQDLGSRLNQGACLIIDYGFPQHEYYHPQRNQGTLMCHYRHRAHSDPLKLVGLQDITAHVNFTALAESASQIGLQVAGYINQGAFLLNNHLLEMARNSTLSSNQQSQLDGFKLSQQIQTLVSDNQMGEMFKVMLLTKRLDQRFSGFSRGDRRGSL